MQDFLTVFKKNDGAKPIAKNFILVPDFNDKTHELDLYSFVLYGDASEVDLSNAGDMLPCIHFNSKTKFPSTDKMPDGFNPQQVLENGKAPGLNIADLHAMGITGKGITVAIIDQPLNTEHIEIKDNIVHYESAGYPEHKEAQFHGTAVSSLLAGKTVGVAPDAKIVYFAANNTKKTKMAIADENFQKVLRQYFPKNINFEETIKDILDGRHQTDAEFRHKIEQIIAILPPDIKEQVFSEKNEIDFTHRANALRKILFMNTRLPQDKKISAVSISWGMLGTDPESTKLIKQLIESGVMVLTTDSHRFYGDKGNFITTDRKMNSNPDDIQSYEVGYWKVNKDNLHDFLLVPAGGRTIAGYLDYDDYIYCGEGGMSWSTPYLVGVYALAKQIAPNLTPHRFFEIAQQTAVSNGKTGNNKIVQPQRIIQHLQNEMVLQQQNTPDR